MLTNIGSANWATDHDWKYSELVNFSTEDFLASIKNNVSIAVNNIEIANQTHDYDAIVENATRIDQEASSILYMMRVFEEFGLYHKSGDLNTPSHPEDIEENTSDIIFDARMRIEERNKELWNAEVPERDKELSEDEEWADFWERNKELQKLPEWAEYFEYMREYENQTKGKSKPDTVTWTVREEFGNYSMDRKDEVKVRVKRGTDIIHAMAVDDLPTEHGTTADSADYTITSSGTRLKGYIDYTMDGFVVIIEPRKKSLTKREFIKILDTFHRD